MSDEAGIGITFAGVGLLLVASGFLLFWLARRGASGALKRNQFAGIRTSATLASDAAWFAAHKASEKQTRIGGYGGIVGGLGALAAGAMSAARAPQEACIAVFLASTLGTSIWMLAWVLRGAAVGQKAALDIPRHTDSN
ncbi:SdpI family protein [Leucobacter sp. cx-328]|uniref:SdpI family protein n=1 Tax=unclassified Leucobacter TaxID=2621730 RepID=UPI00165E5425|nr:MULTISPECIES: SdpI family protein [unclassified Leucobacter]MBC9943116.1 SdpI family protein [Leucobacter sp. cx-328]